MATQNSGTRRDFLRHTAAMGAAGFLGLNLPAASAKAAAQQPSGDYRVGIYPRPWDQHD